MNAKRKKAIELAVEALLYLRRQRYAAGNAAFDLGHDLDFAIKAHAKYKEYTDAIVTLKSMIDEPVQIAFSVNSDNGGRDA